MRLCAHYAPTLRAPNSGLTRQSWVSRVRGREFADGPYLSGRPKRPPRLSWGGQIGHLPEAMGMQGCSHAMANILRYQQLKYWPSISIEINEYFGLFYCGTWRSTDTFQQKISLSKGKNLMQSYVTQPLCMVWKIVRHLYILYPPHIHCVHPLNICHLGKWPTDNCWLFIAVGS